MTSFDFLKRNIQKAILATSHFPKSFVLMPFWLRLFVHREKPNYFLISKNVFITQLLQEVEKQSTKITLAEALNIIKSICNIKSKQGKRTLNHQNFLTIAN